MKKHFFIFILSIFICLTTNCTFLFATDFQLSMVSSNPFNWGNYEVFGSNTDYTSVTFTINPVAIGDYYIGFSTSASGNELSYTRYATDGTNNLNYQIYKSNSPPAYYLYDIPDTDHADKCISYSAVDTNPHDEDFYIYIDENQVVPPGTYSDTIILQGYEGAYDDMPPATATGSALSCHIQFTVLESIELSFEDKIFSDTEIYTANIGTLRKGAPHDFDIFVRTNNGYDLTAQSTNQGYLTGQTAGNTGTIRYGLYIDGVRAHLSQASADTVITESGTTDIEGNYHDASIVVRLTNNALADTYVDTLNITVETP
jgi:spore coat protein U-like protein